MQAHLLIFYFLGAIAFTLGRLAYDEWQVAQSVAKNAADDAP